jgi:hypothetical protein
VGEVSEKEEDCEVVDSGIGWGCGLVDCAMNCGMGGWRMVLGSMTEACGLLPRSLGVVFWECMDLRLVLFDMGCC